MYLLQGWFTRLLGMQMCKPPKCGATNSKKMLPQILSNNLLGLWLPIVTPGAHLAVLWAARSGLPSWFPSWRPKGRKCSGPLVPHRSPKRQNCCGPCVGTSTWGPNGISMGLPCPHTSKFTHSYPLWAHMDMFAWYANFHYGYLLTSKVFRGFFFS